jgi:hypothetical protein
MGNSNTKSKPYYYVSIRDIPKPTSDDPDPEPVYLYSNLTDQLEEVEDFLFGNVNSIISKNIRHDIDTWMEKNKKALDELEQEKLKEEKEIQVPITLYDKNIKTTLYDLPEDDDDVNGRLAMRAEAERDEQMRRHREIIVGYKPNPNPYNHYITDKGYDKCNKLVDFFDASKYSSHYSTGFEYFVCFFQRYMTEDFSWKGNKHIGIPLDMRMRAGNGVFPSYYYL